jgi:hypothetical protein
MIQRKADTPSAAIGDALLLMSIERGQYFSFNSVGRRIWELLEHPATRQDLLCRLSEEYEIEPGLGARHLSEFLTKLRELDLVTETCA